MGHGGDIYRNRVDLDFSVNLNPAPVPEAVRQAIRAGIRDACAYPDPEQEKVRTAIAKADGVKAENVFAGNGASELILAAVRAVSPKKAVLMEPCYLGYSYALQSLSDCEIIRVQLDRKNGFSLTGKECEDMDLGTGMLFLTDPWNPSGGNIPDTVLLSVLERAEERGNAVLLDQSFLFLSDKGAAYQNPGAAGAADLIRRFENLMILRSYTKLFSLPGIRMGYILAREDMIGRIRRQLPEWNLSSPSGSAMEACASLLSEGEEVFDCQKNAEERAYLSDALKKLGCAVYPSDTIYILFEADPDLYHKLLQRGILIRDCSDYNGLGRGYFRVAVKDHASNSTLIRTMEQILS